MTNGGQSVHIAQGEFAIGTAPDTRISTLLGSCIAVCLNDPVVRIGGMNHILLPDGCGTHAAAAGYGANLMELLINALIKRGADKSRLQAKLFGGGRMVAGLSAIGDRNVDFAISYLEAERITCLNKSVGGTSGRRLLYWPYSGKARQKLMDAPVREAAPVVKAANDVELF